MKFLYYIICLAFICFSCTATQEIAKGPDPGVGLEGEEGNQPTPSVSTYDRPTDLTQLMEVLEFTPLEIIEFKRIYKEHASQILAVNSSDRDNRAKIIEKTKIIESRDRLVLRMLEGSKRNIYLDYLHDVEKRKKDNTKKGQNDKM